MRAQFGARRYEGARLNQVLQSLANGSIEVAEVPCPCVKPEHILIRTSVSLISAGTERMLVEFGKASWIAKARKHPDRVRDVLRKIKTDGLSATIRAVKTRLDEPLPLGYCNVGVVLEVGEGVSEFLVGDRVVSNGNHAEVVCVPKNLCARVPEGVCDEDAAFTVLGAIALQGIRLANPTFGESFVVSGLGLLGLIGAQLLRATGCRVLGLDPNAKRCELARSLGVEALHLSEGTHVDQAGAAFCPEGVDGVLITAATSSNEPVRQAAHLCRKRGRIVLVGVTGLDLDRNDFYKKELSFQVSCAYGPGRYDPSYEQGGQDYPRPFVRWTAQRNFEAVLGALADRSLSVQPLATSRIPLERATQAYDLITDDPDTLGVLLQYPDPGTKPEAALRNQTVEFREATPAPPQAACVSIIGAGLYARSTLLPALRDSGATLRTVAATNSLSASRAAKSFGFEEATTDVDRVLSDPSTNTIIIATRHDSHARLAVQALRAGKNVFVEKPLALTLDELGDVIEAYQSASQKGVRLMVGFNRRFAPPVVRLKTLLEANPGPKAFVATVNAGAIPDEHWTQDPHVGGGRIVGEACHFIDLLRHLSGSRIASVRTECAHGSSGPIIDVASVHLAFKDGSIGTVHYLANGSRDFPKERIEVFSSGSVVQIDNFRRMRGFSWPGFRAMNLRSQDKGQAACLQAFVSAVSSGVPSPIPASELFESSRAAILAALADGDVHAMLE